MFGVEGDIQASGADDTFAPWKFSNPWFGTVRGRVGYAFNNVLFYGTGGLAFGELRGETFGLSESHTTAGWTVGVGAEIGFAPELDRQGRISLRRSVEQPLHHHRRAQQLSVRPGPRRRELSLLVEEENTSRTPGRSRPGFFCVTPDAAQRAYLPGAIAGA